MIEELKHKVENVLGHKLSSSADYIALSKSLHQRLCILVSPTTLKRVFGYLKEGVRPRNSTLDVLAQYVGYRDYEDFTNDFDLDQSNPIISESLNCSDLPIGQMVRLMWSPDRDCIFRHDGDCMFTVVEAKNSKLCVGDTFRCHVIIQHEPLYLDCYKHKDNETCAYVAGRINGVTYQLL